MPSRRIALALLSILIPLLVTGCTDDPVSPERPFTVSATGLVPLGASAHYELWFSYPKSANSRKGQHADHEDANYFSVGRFNVNASGALVGLDGGAARFAIPSGYNAQLIGDALVTIERVGDGHDEPGPRVLGGLITGSATKAAGVLTPEDGDALGGRILSDSTGYFSLAAATSADAADSVSGVWFVNFLFATNGTPIDTLPGLALPPQPLNPDNPDWTYTAWLVRNEGTPQAEYISLGRFSGPDAADSSGAGPGAGSLASAALKFPGEDFVTGTRRALNDGTYGVEISVDPSNIAIARPVVTVLKADKIAPGTPSHLKVAMFRPLQTATLQFDLDR